MTTDFRALCAELTAWAEKTSAHYFQSPDVLLRARAALADGPAVPQGREPAAVTGQLSDEELLKLAQQYSVVYLLGDGSACHPFQEGYDMRNDVLNFARAVLARWGNPAPQSAAVTGQPRPVPVSERLPGPEDCDAEGRCWWGTPSFVNCYSVTQSAQWRLSAPDDRFGSEVFWLPTHALPLPEVGE